MVYINLSVNCIQTATAFYVEKLGLFDHFCEGRLICNQEVDLIIDLTLQGCERHLTHFGQDHFSRSSFEIHLGGDIDDTPIEIIEHLLRNGVEYKETRNLGGHWLQFVDPSTNRFTLHSHLGVLV